MTYEKHSLEHILYGSQTIEAKDNSHPAPPAATMLVSLFLILITFFVVLNSHAKPDESKRKIVFQSMLEKFGKPTDELQTFGEILKPKVQDYTLELEEVLGKNAVVASTINGDQTTITFPKDLFFYADETDLREDKILLAQKTSAILQKLQNGKSFKLVIIAGLENYETDKAKLTALKNAMAIAHAEFGLDAATQNQFKLEISNE